jgi:endonuclease-3
VKKAPANAAIVLKLLPRYYPDAHCALDHKNAFELLIATILSAQCTDERVNIVTKGLFAKYPTPEKMAKAKQEDLEELIRSAGFYKNKAKNIKACSQALVAKHHGQVPDKMEDLVALAGVGRKTANVVLGNAFDIASGIVVDTHVTRLSNRLGWVKGEDAVAIEKRLCEFVPRDHWIKLSHELIFHGRQICKARKPLCERCFLLEHCPQKGV